MKTCLYASAYAEIWAVEAGFKGRCGLIHESRQGVDM